METISSSMRYGRTNATFARDPRGARLRFARRPHSGSPMPQCWHYFRELEPTNRPPIRPLPVYRVEGPKLFDLPILLGLAYFGMSYLSWVVGVVILGCDRDRLSAVKLFLLPVTAVNNVVF